MTEPNRPCPVCRENGHDSRGDHLFLMEDGRHWCCNRTQHHPDSTIFFCDNGENNEPRYGSSSDGLFQNRSEDSCTHPPDNWSDVPGEEAPEGVFEDDPVPEDVLCGSRGHEESAKRENAGDIFGSGTSSLPGGNVSERQSESENTKSKTSNPAVNRVVGFFDYRSVPARVWEEYGVRCEKIGDEVTKQIYPVTLGRKPHTEKVRITATKDFFWRDKDKAKKKDMFGMNTLPDKVPNRVLVTEGEVDAASAKYMLEKYKVYVLSGMDGDSLKNILDNVDFLERVPTLTFDPDGDAAGNAFCEKFVSLFPDALVMKKSLKDANAMLESGRASEYVDAYFKAEKYKPPSIVVIDDIIKCLEEFVPKGISTPWTSLDDISYGLVPHQIISIGAGPGVGKSTIVRGIQSHLMFHHQVPIGIFSLEESKEMTLRNLVGYQMNKRIHLPGSTYSIEEAMSYAGKLRGKALIYDKRYYNGEWEQIIKSIRYMYADGVKYFWIDPITSLVVQYDSSMQNTMLGKIMSDLSDIIQELPITIALINHLNNPKSGPAHDEGGRVLPSQFTGSKSQWRFSTDMWGIERNVLSEDDDVRNTTIVRILKHRTDGSLTGKFCTLKYDVDTGRLVERDNVFRPADTSKVEKSVKEKEGEDLPKDDECFNEDGEPSFEDFLSGG